MLLNAIKNNLKISMPILLTRLLGIASNLIAMLLIARLGPDALSASALVMGIFSVCVLLVMAFSFSVCALVASANGQQKNEDVGNVMISSFIFNSILAIPFILLFYNITPLLLLLHQPTQVAILTGQYFHGMLFGYLPMIWASILEQFFVGIGKPRYIVYLSIIGVFVMPLFSFAFIFGYGGFPAMGMLGAGYAVSATSLFSFIFLMILIFGKQWHSKYHLMNLKIMTANLMFKKLYQLGWPIALQFGGEFLAYTLITVMMGWLGVIALAAQQIILQFTSVVAMVPTSVSQATAMLVGQAKGRADDQQIKYQVNISLMVVTSLMFVIAMIYLIMPTTLAHFYLNVNDPQNAAILALATTFFAITALSQCFDGIRNVLAGAYRGIQNTKTPMWISFIFLWGVSIPLAYLLGFTFHTGAIGVRWGFAIGIILGSITIAYSFYSLCSKNVGHNKFNQISSCI